MATILAVEDHADSLYMLQSVLVGHGHHVLTGNNGSEALAVLERSTPDLIVSDILMPQMDGYQFCHAIRSNPATARLPFAFYTATYTDTRDEELAYRLGADLFLRKPMDAQLLIAALESLLSAGPTAARAGLPASDAAAVGALKLYSEQLVRKLEKKMIELEQEIAMRKQAEAERKTLEQQLAQAQKMEILGQVAGGVAHDFNNLLQVIRGSFELAARDPQCTSAIAEHLNEGQGAAVRATALVRQLLMFSRKHPQQPVMLDVRAMVEDLSKLLRRLVGDTISLMLDFSPGTHWVKADPGQLEQVVLNLCVNARDAMPNGGRLNVAVDSVNANLPASGQAAVRIRVTDTGTGIEEAHRGHVFEPFFTTKAEGAGTGIGLALVSTIAKRYGGRVTFDSTVGQGTTFEVLLPSAAPAPRPAVAEPLGKEDVPGGTETILLAEDDVHVRRLGAMFLRSAGYTVIETVDGDEAIRAHEKAGPKISLAVFDCVMPVKSGIEAFTAIRAVRPGLPTLFASGHGYIPPDPAAFPGAPFELLPKPFTRADLLRTVRRLLDHPDSERVHG